MFLKINTNTYFGLHIRYLAPLWIVNIFHTYTSGLTLTQVVDVSCNSSDSFKFSRPGNPAASRSRVSYLEKSSQQRFSASWLHPAMLIVSCCPLQKITDSVEKTPSQMARKTPWRIKKWVVFSTFANWFKGSSCETPILWESKTWNNIHVSTWP